VSIRPAVEANTDPITRPIYTTADCFLSGYENLYSALNSDSSSDKINTKLYNKNTKK